MARRKRRHMLSISEFSKFTGIPRSKLIFYDDIGLFSPAKRGENNYRYYALSQIMTANFVEDLTSFGLPLKEVIELAKTRTPETLRDVLQEERKEFRKKIRSLQETQRLMDTMLTLIDEGLKADEDKISVINLDSYNLIIGPENDYQGADDFYPAWTAFLLDSKDKGRNLKFPIGGMFDEPENFFAHPSLPQRFYFINSSGKDKRPAGKYLAGYARGFYGDMGDLPQRLKSYAEEHKIKLSGPVYNPFLHDELSVADPQNYLMRVAIKIEE